MRTHAYATLQWSAIVLILAGMLAAAIVNEIRHPEPIEATPVGCYAATC